MGTWGDLGRREGVALHGQTEVVALEVFQDVWGCSKLSYSSEIIALKETCFIIFDDSFTKHVTFLTVPYFPALLLELNLAFELT